MFTESTEHIIWAVNDSKEKATGWTFNYQVAKALNGGKQLRNMWEFPYPSKTQRRFGKHPSLMHALLGRPSPGLIHFRLENWPRNRKAGDLEILYNVCSLDTVLSIPGWTNRGEVQMRASQKTHRILMIVFAAFMLVVIACSCGDIDTGTTTGGTTGDATTTTTTGGGGTATVSVVNSSAVDICFLYVSPSVSDDWGEDVLGSDNLLSPGETFDVSVAPGTYDFLAENCDGEEIDSESDVVVTEEGVTWTFTDN
jgi:hypothetical protein